MIFSNMGANDLEYQSYKSLYITNIRDCVKLMIIQTLYMLYVDPLPDITYVWYSETNNKFFLFFKSNKDFSSHFK